MCTTAKLILWNNSWR